MCVIVYKPKNKIISENTILKMWESNPHGAGLVVISKDKHTISKGYFTPEILLQDLESLQNCALALHFRYATHGAITERQCHPFILSSDITTASEVFIETSQPILMHNGVINGFGNNKISDTLDYITNILAHIPCIKARKKLLHSTGSKYLLIEDNKIHFIGKFEAYHGLQVSNIYWDDTSSYLTSSSYPSKNSYNFSKYFKD